MEEPAAEDSEQGLLNVDRGERILAALQCCREFSDQQRIKAGISQYRRLINEI
jgi:hypothetical protein